MPSARYSPGALLGAGKRKGKGQVPWPGPPGRPHCPPSLPGGIIKMSLDVTKGLPGSQDALVEHHRSDLREGPRAANKVKQVEAERVTELPTALTPCKPFICRALITDRHAQRCR